MALEELALADWRRRIAELYARVRAYDDPAVAWDHWRATRDQMFREHPQTPLPSSRLKHFEGLSYFDYDPSARTRAVVEEGRAERLEIPSSDQRTMVFDRIGTATFALYGEKMALGVYWLDTYGGGLFVPFRDTTSGTETYGAGRYLLDTVKGADLGMDGTDLILDFNFAYNPSCSYDSRWVCPLAPPANRLQAAVRAGERHIS